MFLIDIVIGLGKEDLLVKKVRKEVFSREGKGRGKWCVCVTWMNGKDMHGTA
jgi:hypothetical protein